MRHEQQIAWQSPLQSGVSAYGGHNHRYWRPCLPQLRQLHALLQDNFMSSEAQTRSLERLFAAMGPAVACDASYAALRALGSKAATLGTGVSSDLIR